ncbi:LysR family transcriptional regulator [Nocardiopsis sp. ARC36]
MDLDLRKLRYFVAVADRLHFGRAADELHIAQPVLSRQIRALEQDLGTPLLTRDSHGVALTDAGRQLLTDAGPLLASAHAIRRRVTVAAQAVQRLMVGFRAGIAVAPAVRLFAARHPDVLVDVRRIEGDDQAPMLLDGRIDVGYVRLPIAEAGLRVAPLYTEPRVAVLPAGHELADRDQITEADLAGEPLVWPKDTSTQPTRRPHPNAGYLVRGVDETLEHVAAGRASRSWPVRRPCSTHIRTSATCPSRIWRPTRCASRWRHRTPRRWSTTSSPRLRRRPRSRQNAGTMKCGSLEEVPFP